MSLYMDPIIPRTVCGKDILFHWIGFVVSSCLNWSYICESFSVFYPLPFIYLSILISVLYIYQLLWFHNISWNKLVLRFLSFVLFHICFTVLYLLQSHVLLCLDWSHCDLCPDGLLFIYSKLSEWLLGSKKANESCKVHKPWNSHITSNLFCWLKQVTRPSLIQGVGE